jgi:putative redox protein
LLAAFLGCTNVIFNMIAERRGVRIGLLKLKVTADFDTRGVFEDPVEQPFPRIRLQTEVEADASEATIDELRKELAQRCPVSVVLRQAGSLVEEHWTVRPIGVG